ncbi:alpha-L-fucosidase [Aureibaculum sp. 2210JD6-5]|nr:alpha-L-fucosidase [Aureibaculum sp. 2210JD6-5]MDY7396796.1 alpha-L-fucosidase [Aureibaculum sp. 2210JD6-5]
MIINQILKELNKLKLGFLAVALLLVFCSQAQNKNYKDQWQFPAKDSSFYVTAEQQKELYATQAEMKWFKDAKLGIFVHWGPALLKTNVLSWGRNGERPGAGKPATKGVDPEVYDNLYKQFNPKNFDADKWMQQVKDWGAEYIVFTAKHHDGFAFLMQKIPNMIL